MVDARHMAVARRHRLGENAAAAADVEHALSRKRGALVDPVEPQRIDLVQRAKLAVRIPPAMRELAELLELRRIDVHAHASHCPKKSPAEAGLVEAVRAFTSCLRRPDSQMRNLRCRSWHRR